MGPASANLFTFVTVEGCGWYSGDTIPYHRCPLLFLLLLYHLQFDNDGYNIVLPLLLLGSSLEGSDDGVGQGQLRLRHEPLRSDNDDGLFPNHHHPP